MDDEMSEVEKAIVEIDELLDELISETAEYTQSYEWGGSRKDRRDEIKETILDKVIRLVRP
jgi:ferritin-like protein